MPAAYGAALLALALATAEEVARPNLDDVVAKPAEPKARTPPERGEQLIQEGEFEKALAVLRECSEADPLCVTQTASMHFVGLGMPRNTSAAFELYQAAADRGCVEAQYMLGVLHGNLVFAADGGYAMDEALAVLYLYAASTAGHPGALMAMGSCSAGAVLPQGGTCTCGENVCTHPERCYPTDALGNMCLRTLSGAPLAALGVLIIALVYA